MENSKLGRKHIEIRRDDLKKMQPFYKLERAEGYEFIFPTYVDEVNQGKMYLYGYDELASKRYHVRLFGNNIICETKDEAKIFIKTLQDKMDVQEKLFYVSEDFFNYKDFIISGSEGKEIKILTKDDDLYFYTKHAIQEYKYNDDVDRLIQLFKIGVEPKDLVHNALDILNRYRSKDVTQHHYGEVMDLIMSAYTYYEEGSQQTYLDWRDTKEMIATGSEVLDIDLASDEAYDRGIMRALVLDNGDWLRQIVDAGHREVVDVFQRLEEEAGGYYDFSHLHLDKFL